MTGLSADGGGAEAAAGANQAKVREKLKSGTLARRLAEVYDPKRSAEENRDAVKKVIEGELDAVRKAVEQDQNPID
jgi:hypothetical protein